MLAEIPVSPDSLFHGQLINVIVEQAKRARDWEKFCKAVEHCALKKVLTMASGAVTSRPSFYTSRG